MRAISPDRAAVAAVATRPGAERSRRRSVSTDATVAGQVAAERHVGQGGDGVGGLKAGADASGSGEPAMGAGDRMAVGIRSPDPGATTVASGTGCVVADGRCRHGERATRDVRDTASTEDQVRLVALAVSVASVARRSASPPSPPRPALNVWPIPSSNGPAPCPPLPPLPPRPVKLSVIVVVVIVALPALKMPPPDPGEPPVPPVPP